MQAVVKTHRIRVEAERIPEELLEFLRDRYGDVELITDSDEERVEITKSDWYTQLRGTITPGDNMRIYRELRGWTQTELGLKLGGVPRQNVSAMETGGRAISKATAKNLAQILDVSVGKFL